LDLGALWNLIILSPVVNVLITLSQYLFSSFGLTIIVLTIVIRGLMYPLTIKQLQSSRRMQALQPKLAELQKKYGKDKQKLAQEQMRLHKEYGVSPLGCMGPMLIQMPIWIALYQSIIMALAVAPEGLLKLARYLYPWPVVYSALPLSSKFLWLDLARPDNLLLLPILVGGTMWVQQKMTMAPSTDPKQQTQGQMMLWMMPLMFAFFSLSFPSGLALYWVTSSVIGIIIQSFVTGWESLVPSWIRTQTAGDKKSKARQEASLVTDDSGSDVVAPDSAQEEELDDGKSGDKRQDRGGSRPTRIRTSKRQSGRRKDNRSRRS